MSSFVAEFYVLRFVKVNNKRLIELNDKYMQELCSYKLDIEKSIRRLDIQITEELGIGCSINTCVKILHDLCDLYNTINNLKESIKSTVSANKIVIKRIISYLNNAEIRILPLMCIRIHNYMLIKCHQAVTLVINLSKQQLNNTYYRVSYLYRSIISTMTQYRRRLRQSVATVHPISNHNPTLTHNTTNNTVILRDTNSFILSLQYLKKEWIEVIISDYNNIITQCDSSVASALYVSLHWLLSATLLALCSEDQTWATLPKRILAEEINSIRRLILRVSDDRSGLEVSTGGGLWVTVYSKLGLDIPVETYTSDTAVGQWLIATLTCVNTTASVEPG